MGICVWRQRLTIIDACLCRCWAKWLVNNVCSAIMYWSFQQFYPFFVLDLPMLLWKCDLPWLNADSVKPEIMDCKWWDMQLWGIPQIIHSGTHICKKKSSLGLMDCVLFEVIWHNCTSATSILHVSIVPLASVYACVHICVRVRAYVCVCPVHRANALCNHWIQGSMLGFAWTVDSVDSAIF